MRYIIITLLLLLLLTIAIYGKGKIKGYIEAHIDISNECKKLGAFYVGDEVFSCALKKD